MERREDVAGLDPLGDQHLDLDRADRAPHLDAVAARDAELRGVGRVHLEPVAGEELHVARAARHRAGVVVLEPAAGDEDERVLVAGGAARRLVGERGELRAPARQVELVLVEDRRVGAVRRDRPQQAAPADALERHAGEVGRHLGDLPHRVRGRLEAHVVAQLARDRRDDVEVGPRRPGRLDSRLDELDPALGVRERAGLLEERRGGQDHVRVLRRLVLEDVLADEEVERLERRLDVLRVRVGLGDVLAEDVHRLEVARHGRVEHLRDLHPALALHRHAPALLEAPRDLLVGDRPVGGERVRQGAHVGRALDVVLPPERQQRRPAPPDLAGHQREVADQPDDLGAVQVLGHPEAPDDAGVAGLGVDVRGPLQVVRGTPVMRETSSGV